MRIKSLISIAIVLACALTIALCVSSSATAAPSPLFFSTETKNFAISFDEADGSVVSCYMPTFEVEEGMEAWRIDFHFNAANNGGIETGFFRYIENTSGSAGTYSWTNGAATVELLKMDGTTVIWSRSQTDPVDTFAGSLTAYDLTLDYDGTSGDEQTGVDGYSYQQDLASFYSSTPSVVDLFVGDGTTEEFKCRRSIAESLSSSPSGMSTLMSKDVGIYGKAVIWKRQAQKN